MSAERLESQLAKVAHTIEEDAAANVPMQYALVIDGKALLYALSPRLRQQFLQVSDAGSWGAGDDWQGEACALSCACVQPVILWSACSWLFTLSCTHIPSIPCVPVAHTVARAPMDMDVVADCSCK